MTLSDSDRKRLADEIASVLAQAKDGSRMMPFSVAVEIDPVDVPGWLAARPRKMLWYWHGRHGEIEIGGIGDGLSIPGDSAVSSLDRMRMMRERYPDFRPPMFCVRRFNPDERYDDIHRLFPGDICRVPTSMVVRKNNKYSLYISLRILPDMKTNRVLDTIESGIEDTRQKNVYRPTSSLPSIKSMTSFPDQNGWRKNIDNALKAIKRNELEKIVLARRMDYHFEDEIDPLSLMMLLRERNRSCYSILHQPHSGAAFISMTPERLYFRESREISIDAVSSTLPRGLTPDDDAMLERQLLRDDKLRREHRYVADTIMADIASLCEGDPTIDGPSALKLDRIQHIASSITARLRPDVDDAQIMDALHPTPAVAGVPREQAIAMISEIEPFTRGWYAGAIGLMDGDRAEFAVSIRSAIIRGNVVSVYTGGGIVRGSDPDREWDEIESKDILRPLLAERALP